MKSSPLNWKRVALISTLLGVGSLTVALAMLRQRAPAPKARHTAVVIPQGEYDPSEYRAIQVAFWQATARQGACSQAYVNKFMSILEDSCEGAGDAKTIGGGCGHLANPLNYPAVIDAALRYCHVKR